MLLRFGLRRAAGSRQAITDVYDQTRGTFLVRYPSWLILALGLGGVVAFALTGFLNWQPLILYVWLCGLVITLQASIFRHATMRARLIASLTATVLAMLLVAFVQFGNLLPDVIKQSIDYSHLGSGLAANPWTYTVLNFGLIGIFWIDTARRWVRRGRGLAPNEQVALTADEARQAQQHPDMPSLEELIAGDLIAAGLLALGLSVLLQADVLRVLVHGVALDRCTVSLPAALAACAPAGDAAAAPTLTFWDRIQSLIYLPLGLIVLALTATLSGLGAAGGVGATATHASTGSTAAKDRSSSTVIAQDVTDTVLKTLRSAADRRIKQFARNLALSLRTVAWPALVVVAIYGVSEVSLAVRAYLASDKSLQKGLPAIAPGLAWGVAAAFAVAFAAALLVFRWRVADNTLRFLGLIGFVLLLTWWLFSLALTLVNYLLLTYAGLPVGSPFLTVGFSTYVSAAALAIWGAYALIRRSRAARAAVADAAELAPARVVETSGGAAD
jgi:hypothetical protein